MTEVIHFRGPPQFRSNNILKASEWTSLKELAEALEEHGSSEIKLMVALPWNRIIGNTNSGPMIVKDVGIYPVVGIEIKEDTSGRPIMLFLGSEDLPEIEDVIGPRPERVKEIQLRNE